MNVNVIIMKNKSQKIILRRRLQTALAKETLLVAQTLLRARLIIIVHLQCSFQAGAKDAPQKRYSFNNLSAVRQLRDCTQHSYLTFTKSMIKCLRQIRSMQNTFAPIVADVLTEHRTHRGRHPMCVPVNI